MKANRRFLLGLACLACLASAPAAASPTCDDLRQQIEAKIRARGVSQPVVRVIDAGAKPGGQIVGSCERGARRIVYQGGGAAEGPATAAPAAPAAPAAAVPPGQAVAPQLPRKPTVITECADGRVLASGDCKR